MGIWPREQTLVTLTINACERLMAANPEPGTVPGQMRPKSVAYGQ